MEIIEEENERKEGWGTKDEEDWGEMRYEDK
jgi:hypothetical protein